MSRRSKYKEKIQAADAQTAASAVQTADAFSNPLFRLGYGSQSPLEATEYPLTRLTDNYALLNSLYRDNWVVQNVVQIIPDDMCREWFTLSGVSPGQAAEMEREQRRIHLRESINEGLRWGRLYGGAAGLMLIRGQEQELDKPLDVAAILPGAFRGLHILDRWSGIVPSGEIITDISNPDFGLPEYYQISDAESRIVARVHHSRVVRFTGRELPYLERIAELHWGESEVEALYADMVKHDNVSANMAALTFRANIDTMEVQNLDQLFSLTGTEHQRRFWNVMQAQSVMQSNFGVRVINKGDAWHNHQYTFTGLRDVYESMCLDLAGAARMPVTKLFGRAPAGMNATGESDTRNYYDYIDALRESKLRPALEKILPVLCASVWGAEPEGADIVFPPLWTPTAVEVAGIAQQKTSAIINAYREGLLTVGAAQKELKSMHELTGLFDSITDEEIERNAERTYQDVTALRDPLAGLGYDLPEATAAEETEQNGEEV